MHDFLLQSPSSDPKWIWELFKGRCVVCHKKATEINEIIPRSRSKKSIKEWKNRVTMCQSCHVHYHAGGVSLNKLVNLQEKRKEYLRFIGREKYV